MDEASESLKEDQLLNLFLDTTQSLRGLFEPERSEAGVVLEQESGQAGQGRPTETLTRLLTLLRELSGLHSHRVRAWREALSVSTRTLMGQDLETNTTIHSHGEGACEEQTTQRGIVKTCMSGSVPAILLSVLGDVEILEQTLCSIIVKVDSTLTTFSKVPSERTDSHTRTDEGRNDPKDLKHLQISSEGLEHVDCTPDGFNSISLDEALQQPLEDKDFLQNHALSVGIGGKQRQCSEDTINANTHAISKRAEGRDTPTEERDPHREDLHTQSAGERREEQKEGKRQEGEKRRERGKTNGETAGEVDGSAPGWVTVGLPGRSGDSGSDVPAACYVTAPVEVAEVMTCEVADGLSSLMVSQSEELLSCVLRVGVPERTRCPLPLTLALPFQTCYRGNYRDVTVKVVGQGARVSYVTPVSTEATYAGQRGSFAVVRVYSLGVFAVLSQLRRESFTVTRRGLSLKLCADPRVCLDYPPGSYTTTIVAQAVVQPVEAAHLCSVKSRSDVYHSVVSTSPLLYLTHPSTLTPRRPLQLTLPCPPNPEKRRAGEESDHPHSTSAVQMQRNLSPPQLRTGSVAVASSRESANEQLVVLGWQEQQWNLLDKVSVKNLQNGLVSFEVTGNVERLIVVRVLSSVRPSHLTVLAEQLEAVVGLTAVTVALHRKRGDPHGVVLAALPSRDLSWELSKLRAQALCGPPEPSGEIPMREGEQLHLRFRGNITSTGVAPHILTFHNQRSNRIQLTLKEVDPFGNYSSPHYKGTAIFFRVTRGHLVWKGDQAVLMKDYLLEEPVCKLALTLPKKERNVPRPWSAKVLSHDQTDTMSDEVLAWLCGELSEEDAALLVMGLGLRCSSAQLARLRAPEGLPRQALHLLALWRRGLPSSLPKGPLLARCLRRCGRPDLAKELLEREVAKASASPQGSVGRPRERRRGSRVEHSRVVGLRPLARVKEGGETRTSAVLPLVHTMAATVCEILKTNEKTNS